MSQIERMYLEFLFVAYSAVWIMMFGFLYRMLRRTRVLERDLTLLKTSWTPEKVRQGDSEASSGAPPISGPSV